MPTLSFLLLEMRLRCDKLHPLTLGDGHDGNRNAYIASAHFQFQDRGGNKLGDTGSIGIVSCACFCSKLPSERVVYLGCCSEKGRHLGLDGRETLGGFIRLEITIGQEERLGGRASTIIDHTG